MRADTITRALMKVREDDVRESWLAVHLPDTKEEALRELKDITGQDFGFDASKWEQFLKALDEDAKSEMQELYYARRRQAREARSAKSTDEPSR
jgi:hypothetical protein